MTSPLPDFGFTAANKRLTLAEAGLDFLLDGLETIEAELASVDASVEFLLRPPPPEDADPGVARLLAGIEGINIEACLADARERKEAAKLLLEAALNALPAVYAEWEAADVAAECLGRAPDGCTLH